MTCCTREGSYKLALLTSSRTKLVSLISIVIETAKDRVVSKARLRSMVMYGGFLQL